MKLSQIDNVNKKVKHRVLIFLTVLGIYERFSNI